jgi:putative methyltransferase (TIGR04325 family)
VGLGVSRLKEFARDWLPPVVVRLLQQRRSSGLCFEGDFTSWEEASAHCTGYDAKDILEKVLAATLKVKRGEAVFERDSVLFNEIEYDWPVLSGLLWAAASSGGKLNVLDFGGALGSSYFQNLQFLKWLPVVKWNVIEQSHYVDAGRNHIQDEQLRFYKTIEECLAENQPNVILLSSVLQYIEMPQKILEHLLDQKVSYLIINRTPFVRERNSILSIQRVPRSIFSATLPAWLLSEETISDILKMSNYVRVASFINEPSRSDRFLFKGFIFKRGNL